MRKGTAMRKLAIALPIVFAVAALAACGGAKTGTEAEATPASAPAPGAIDENTPVHVSAKPRPAWAANYPGSPVADPVMIITDGKASAQVEFVTNDTPGEVIAFYRGKAEAAGLTAGPIEVNSGGKGYSATGPAGSLTVATMPQDARKPDQGPHAVILHWSVPDPG